MAAATAATIGIKDYELPYETHNLYDVLIDDVTIHTLVTHTPALADQWITEVEALPDSTRLVVGLDVEWRPNRNGQEDNPVAVIQLCTGRRCLIFQLLHAPQLPPLLAPFLKNPNHTFVGVGIEGDVERLVEGYELGVRNMVDLRRLAAEKKGKAEYRAAGIRTLVRDLMGKEVDKPKAVTMSRWDNEWLMSKQVQYAVVDAFLSFEIGTRLGAKPAHRIKDAYYCGSPASTVSI